MTTQDLVESFYQFATNRLSDDDSGMSVDELYDLWRSEHQTPEATAEDIAAIQAAIDDMNRGDHGRDAETIELELRSKYNLPVR